MLNLSLTWECVIPCVQRVVPKICLLAFCQVLGSCCIDRDTTPYPTHITHISCIVIIHTVSVSHMSNTSYTYTYLTTSDTSVPVIQLQHHTLWYLKGVAICFLKFCFAKSILKRPQNFGILVCNPHNYGGIVGGRDKNFEVSRPFKHS